MKMKKRPLLLVAGLVMASMTFGFFILKISNGPAEGVITQVASGSERNPEKEETKPAVLEGTYIRFEYPGSYRKIASQKNTSLETVNLLGNITAGGEIAVSVSRGPLSEDSAVKLRRLQKQTYNEQALKLPRITGVVFTKNPPGFEKTAIIEQGDNIARIAVSSSVGRDLSEVFDLVTSSFSWK